MYRPPNATVDWWTSFENMILNAKENYDGFILICGDLKYDFKTVLSLVDMYNLECHIHEPTCYNNNSESALDQFISNCSNYIKKVEVLNPGSTNYHCTIGIWLKSKKEML